MIFKIKGSIILPKNKIPAVLINTYKELLTYPNPFDSDKELKGYRETVEKLYVPKSFKNEIKKYLPNAKFERITIDAPTNFNLSSTFVLRPYQKQAEIEILDILKTQHSVLLTAETGAGKSYSITSVIQQLKQRTLILAHLSMLTDQLKKEMSANSTAKVLELSSATTEKDIISSDIIVGTFALLHRNLELVWALSKNIGTLVIDETENILSDTRLNIIFRLNPKYSIFMSATPTRELMQQTPLLRYFISNNIVKMSVPEKYTITPKVKMLDYVNTQWHSPLNTNLYKSSLWRFLKDNSIVEDTCNLIMNFYNEYKGCQWVIADLTKAQNYIKNLLINKGMLENEIEIIRGTTSKKDRKEILENVNNFKTKVLIGSAPLSAGVSIPNLNIAYRLMPHSSSDELLIQQIGRLKRYAEFKEKYPPLFIDYAIEGSLAYKGKQRFKWYKETFDTEFIRSEDLVVQ